MAGQGNQLAVPSDVGVALAAPGAPPEPKKRKKKLKNDKTHNKASHNAEPLLHVKRQGRAVVKMKGEALEARADEGPLEKKQKRESRAAAAERALNLQQVIEAAAAVAPVEKKRRHKIRPKALQLQNSELLPSNTGAAAPVSKQSMHQHNGVTAAKEDGRDMQLGAEPAVASAASGKQCKIKDKLVDQHLGDGQLPFTEVIALALPNHLEAAAPAARSKKRNPKPTADQLVVAKKKAAGAALSAAEVPAKDASANKTLTVNKPSEVAATTIQRGGAALPPAAENRGKAHVAGAAAAQAYSAEGAAEPQVAQGGQPEKRRCKHDAPLIALAADLDEGARPSVMAAGPEGQINTAEMLAQQRQATAGAVTEAQQPDGAAMGAITPAAEATAEARGTAATQRKKRKARTAATAQAAVSPQPGTRALEAQCNRAAALLDAAAAAEQAGRAGEEPTGRQPALQAAAAERPIETGDGARPVIGPAWFSSLFPAVRSPGPAPQVERRLASSTSTGQGSVAVTHALERPGRAGVDGAGRASETCIKAAAQAPRSSTSVRAKTQNAAVTGAVRMATGRSWKQDLKRTDVKHGMFSSEEKQTLMDAVREAATARGQSTEEFSWLFDSRAKGNYGATTQIAAALPSRKRKAVWSWLTNHLHPARAGAKMGEVYGSWTAEEDRALRDLIEQHGRRFKDIGEALGRVPQACKDRWRVISLGDRMNRGPWSKQEADQLSQLVQEYKEAKSLAGDFKGRGGTATERRAAGLPGDGGGDGEEERCDGRQLLDGIDWEYIAKEMGTRNSVQCIQKCTFVLPITRQEHAVDGISSFLRLVWDILKGCRLWIWRHQREQLARYRTLRPSMVQQGEWARGDDGTLLAALLEGGYEESWEPDWDTLVPGRAGVVVRRRWLLLSKSVPDYVQKGFRECVEALAQQHCPQLSAKHINSVAGESQEVGSQDQEDTAGAAGAYG